MSIADRLDVGVQREQICERIVRTRASRNARRARAPTGLESASTVKFGARRAGAVALAVDTAVSAVVVMKEDLLERRLPTGERRDGLARERRDQRSDAARDLEP